jgi:hypothetical protein
MPPALDLLALLSLVSRRRSLACPEYDCCLDTAYRRGWRSWTCERCPFFPLASTFRAIEVGSQGQGLGQSPLAEA